MSKLDKQAVSLVRFKDALVAGISREGAEGLKAFRSLLDGYATRLAATTSPMTR